MKKLLLLLFAFSLNANSQNYNPNQDKEYKTEQGHIFIGNSLKINNGGMITVGEDIKLGKGSDTNGTFRYIQVNEGSVFRGTNTGGTNYGVQEANALPNKYNGLKAKIVDIVERGRKKTGYKVFVIIGVGEMKRYQIDLDSALEYGEVIIDGYANNNKKETTNTSISLADEIKKLNELKESGLLTEEEYQQAKQKLLE